MKNILIGGCGHGGLVAGALLARKGFNVTVVEQNDKNDIGHDWEDRFEFSNLTDILNCKLEDLPADSWRFRGDCAFVSPAKKKKVIIEYTDENRQKIMWRKSLINLLVDYAEKCGVNFVWNTKIVKPVIENNYVKGFSTDKGDYSADMVIDSCGAFSPLRTQLPDSFSIERKPKNGDLFYAWRAYFDKSYDENPRAPFEVYMYHEGEKGLSWLCTNKNNVDVLIGRIYKLDNDKVNEQVDIFRKDHPWLGYKILNGGNYGIIPVRRPLTRMVGNGYAAIGDSAFMTMPMNGMGIDLSLNAGRILASVISECNEDYSVNKLWKYNYLYHRNFGGPSSKNEGLKNAILSMPSEGVDFLFESEVIQSSDLAGAGRNVNFKSLLGKFVRGMKKPKYFFALLKGLVRGSKASKLYTNAPENFDTEKIIIWNNKIEKLDIHM